MTTALGVYRTCRSFSHLGNRLPRPMRARSSTYVNASYLRRHVQYTWAPVASVKTWWNTSGGFGDECERRPSGKQNKPMSGNGQSTWSCNGNRDWHSGVN